MDLLTTFAVMSGTATGRDHRLATPPAPNQDRVLTVVRHDLIVGCFADGCSSSEHSAVGADLTVNTLLTAILNRHKSGKPFDPSWFKRMYWYLVETLWETTKMYLTASNHDDRDAQMDVIMSHMLATAGGCVIDTENVHLFGVPEVWGIYNGDQFDWPAAKKDHAPYPALAFHNRGELYYGNFRVETYPTTDLRQLMMGTDGLVRLSKVCSTPTITIPGTDTPVGGIDQVFSRDEFYTDPNACSEWLNTLAAGTESAPGLLGDDTSFFGLRRKEQ